MLRTGKLLSLYVLVLLVAVGCGAMKPKGPMSGSKSKGPKQAQNQREEVRDLVEEEFQRLLDDQNRFNQGFVGEGQNFGSFQPSDLQNGQLVRDANGNLIVPGTQGSFQNPQTAVDGGAVPAGADELPSVTRITHSSGNAPQVVRRRRVD